MNRESSLQRWLWPVLTLCLVGCMAGNQGSVGETGSHEGDRVSRFGEYQGYSSELYDEWVTTSQYVTTRDGTRLAVDISRPAVDGVAVETPHPALWTYSRYHRRWRGTPYADVNPVVQRLIKHGYVVAAASVRGGGASFGRYVGLFSEAETNDAYDVIDWLARQSWSDGNIGMFGGSYLGITQYMAASKQHPALKALIPDVSYFDFYDAIDTGGIHRSDMVRHWTEGVRRLDVEIQPAPVDDDPDGVLARQAVLEHQDNFDPISELGGAPFRDSRSESFGWYRDTPSMVIDKINGSGVAIYHWSGWYDAYVMGAFLHYANFTGPEKLVVGPWAHDPSTPELREEKSRLMAAESHRWFDYWLKGIDNGVLDETPIHYAIVDTPNTAWRWTSTDSLPTAENNTYELYFAAGGRTDDRVPEDNGLRAGKPDDSAAFEYAVDLETTTGTSSRWDANFGGTMDYPDMTANDVRSLTFTTEPLEEDTVVFGVPVVTLFVSSTATDTDFYALLEEVDSEGYSYYVSEGMLRGSLRKLADPPWDDLGIPWQRCHESDVQPLTPGEVVELKFHIYPTAYLFNKGHRIRIAIMGADKDNTEPPPAPGAVMTIMTGGEQASRISFPVANK